MIQNTSNGQDLLELATFAEFAVLQTVVKGYACHHMITFFNLRMKPMAFATVEMSFVFRLPGIKSTKL